MKRTLCAEIKSHTGEKISAAGWVHRIRDLGGISFIILRDRSGMVQLVFEEKPPVTLESVIRVTGTVAENPKAPGGFEIQVAAFAVLSEAAPDLPVAVNQDPSLLNIDALLDNRPLTLRNPKIRAIFTLQSDILEYFSGYMRKNGFTEIKSSKLIGSGSEGGTGLFEVNYFDRKVFLAQSPQLYKQTMVASGMERVFEIGAAYRAEKHETPRHLNEYVSLDIETAFIESDHELMDLENGILAHIFEEIRVRNSDILELYSAEVPDPEAVMKTPRISHDEAKQIISRMAGKKVFDLSPEGERLLCEWASKEHGIDMVYVNGFPRKSRPFYTYPDGTKTMSFDCIFRGLEITSGGRRINDYAMLLENLSRSGLAPEGLKDYLDVFKYGCPPHGGFAIGLERLTQKILGLANVKEASLFPRDRKRVRP